MNKEVISDKQGISMMVMFIIGTAVIMARGLDAKKDLWMAILVAFVTALPLVYLYAYLHEQFPGKNLYDMIEISFGKYIGKIIILLYTWYFFHTAVLVALNYLYFVFVTALAETPRIMVMIFMMLLCIFIIKAGIEVIGRWAEFFVLILASFIFLLLLFVIKEMDINHLRPFYYGGIKPILKGAYSVFVFPCSQVVAFTAAFSHFKTKKSSYHIYLRGLVIGVTLILIISIGNIMVLGVYTASNMYYPSHGSAMRIIIGDLFQRLEIILATAFSFGAFIKISIFFLAACKGMTKAFGIKDYRIIVIPIGALMINLSYFLHSGVMDYFEFILEVWLYYAFPFHIFFPICLLIVYKMKGRRRGNI
ncbi:MAG: endospore germination permease [Marinisporobacter sp.]|jgi:spore germination protein KB|nr:endospore germination permease [Marinisporobacter sp.]